MQRGYKETFLLHRFTIDSKVFILFNKLSCRFYDHFTQWHAIVMKRFIVLGCQLNVQFFVAECYNWFIMTKSTIINSYKVTSEILTLRLV